MTWIWIPLCHLLFGALGYIVIRQQNKRMGFGWTCAARTWAIVYAFILGPVLLVVGWVLALFITLNETDLFSDKPASW